MTKSEFERRAAEMKARNLTRRQFRTLPPPRSIFAQPLATPSPATVYIRDSLREVDIKRLSPPLAAIRNLGTLETDRDGLLDLAQAGLQISVSPDLGSWNQGVRCRSEDGRGSELVAPTRTLISGIGPVFSVTASSRGSLEMIQDQRRRSRQNGERCPRRPTGALVVSLAAGHRKVMVSDKRGTRMESKLPELLTNTEALAARG